MNYFRQQIDMQIQYGKTFQSLKFLFFKGTIQIEIYMKQKMSSC